MNNLSESGAERRQVSNQTPWRSRRRLPKMSGLVMLSWLVLFGLVVMALGAPVLAPYDVREQQLLNRLAPPSAMGGTEEHVLGTDHLGRDVLSRLLFAMRTTLLVAALGTAIGLALGTSLGLLSALAGGFVDASIMFLVDVQASLPFVLVALAMIAFFGSSMLLMILVVGVAGWEVYARVVRGQVLSMRGLIFVEAARALGAKPTRVALKHVLPNVATTLYVMATVNFSHVILLESALSFLGLGVQPPRTSLGSLLGSGREYMLTNWTLAAIPGATIVLITVAISLIGDWLTEWSDPRQRL